MNMNNQELKKQIDQLTERVDMLTSLVDEMAEENNELTLLRKAVGEMQQLMQKDGKWFVHDVNVSPEKGVKY